MEGISPLDCIQQFDRLKEDDNKIFKTTAVCFFASGLGLPTARYLQCSTITQVAIGSFGGLVFGVGMSYIKFFRKIPEKVNRNLTPTKELKVQYGHLPAYWSVVDITECDAIVSKPMDREFLPNATYAGAFIGLSLVLLAVSGLGRIIQGRQARHIKMSIFSAQLMNVGMGWMCFLFPTIYLKINELNSLTVVEKNNLWLSLEPKLREKLNKGKTTLTKEESELFFSHSEKNCYAFSTLTTDQMKNLDLSVSERTNVWVRNCSGLDQSVKYEHLTIHPSSTLQPKFRYKN